MFNWFRRQFSDQTPKGDRAQTKPDEEKQSQTPQPAQTEAKSAADEQAETSSAQESQEALDWAKAAYKNIQQRKLQEKADLEATQAQTTVEEGSTAETQTTSEEGSTAETQTTAEETTPEATPVAE
ncbi:MAG: hypothetical protein SAJ37_04065, partial [Oscillatoria sp. PMC 1068.18]|nr:hypothetical protein [Oscillatoria sp. PMC 1076.18]MEC4987902.1 hypothetical protein [Oscillatoria sp. PMC 1068.18]